MKIAIFGAGAIGGFLGVKLHQAGADVTSSRAGRIWRRCANGLTLKSEGETLTVRPRCTDEAAEAGRRIM